MFYYLFVACFFFFSSRRRHTRFKCDWSSDVCSSDLNTAGQERRFFRLEWFKAIDEMKFRPPEFPFIQPIVIDDTPLDSPGIPREFTSRHMRKIDALAELVDDARRPIRERHRERRSA